MYTIYDDNSEIVHQSKTLSGIRRYVTKTNVDSVQLVGKDKIVIYFKNGDRLPIDFRSEPARTLALKSWTNLKKVKRT